MTGNDRIDPVYGYIDNKVRSLKATTTRLSKKIKSLEMSGLQEQITTLSSQVKSLDSSLLRLEQEHSHLRILHNLLWALWVLVPKDDANSISCTHFIRERAASSLTQVLNSKTPTEVANTWYSDCRDYFRNHGYPDLFQ